MAIEVESLTAQQIVESRSVTRCTTGRRSPRLRRWRWRAPKACTFHDRRRTALPRFQLAADGREHRPWRQARARRHRAAGGDASLHLTVPWPTRAARFSARSSRAVAGRAREDVLHARRRGMQRERDPIAKAYTGRQKVLARYRSYHGATYATINAHRRPSALGEREPTDARGRARARPVPRQRSVGPTTARPRSLCCARRSSSRVRRPSRRSSSSRWSARTVS